MTEYRRDFLATFEKTIDDEKIISDIIC